MVGNSNESVSPGFSLTPRGDTSQHLFVQLPEDVHACAYLYKHKYHLSLPPFFRKACYQFLTSQRVTEKYSKGMDPLS